MLRNHIMLVFPAYTDSTEGNCWTYSALATVEELKTQIKRLIEFVDFFREEECDMIYDSKNVEAYLYPLEILPDCYPSWSTIYRNILKTMEDCRKHPIGSPDKVYRFNHQDIKDDIRCELAARWQKDMSQKYVLVLHADKFTEKSYTLEWDENHLKVMCYPTKIHPVFNWLSQHRLPKRVYNWNPKHGENGKGAHTTHAGQPVSVLLCSIQQAEELMKQAIGEKGYDTLFAFDPSVGKYMEFKAEKKSSVMGDADLERKYHSYHIDDPSRIARSIKEKLDKLMGLNSHFSEE